MKILFVSQHYWPEPFNSCDICEELVRRGHEVTVLTGQPNYPEGDFYPGYGGGAVFEEERNGVRVVRSKLHPRKTGVVHRVWNYYSFSFQASRLARKLPAGFDVVYSFQTSPVMMANPAIAYCKKHGTPLLIHVFDIWPECLLMGGIKSGGLIYNHYKRVSRRIYSAADRLALGSRTFVDYLRDTVGIDAGNAFYLPQYAEDFFGQDVVDATDLNDADFPRDALNLMFAGNVGAAQSVDTIIRAASLLKGEPFMFHIMGSGSELESCERLAHDVGADNVVFHGRHPVEEMPAYYAKVDAMLISFAKTPLLVHFLPRKLQTCLYAGKPVIGTVIGASREVIEAAECGVCCDPEDPEGLARACRKMASYSVEERRRMGVCGKRYYETHFSKAGFFAKLEGELAQLKGTGHGC